MTDIFPINAASLLPDSSEAQKIQAALSRAFPRRTISRVLFVAPPDGNVSNFNYETCKLGRYPNFPPYGVGVLASNLRRDGIQVDLVNLNNAVLKACSLSKSDRDFDFTAVVREELDRHLKAFRPDLVGVTCMFSQTHQSTIDVCNLIKEIVPDMPLALGGVHITNSMVDEKTRDVFLKDFPMVNFFFMYESDLAFPRFIRVIDGKAPLIELAQVTLRPPAEI
jgi:hypothetical protein